MNSLSECLYEMRGYAEDIVPKLQDWYSKCQRPGELPKRIKTALPIAIDSVAALLFFPKTTVLGLVTSAVMPDAMDRILHMEVIQEMDRAIERLNMTALQKHAVVITGVAITGFCIEDPYLQVVPALFAAKIVVHEAVWRYYDCYE